MFLYLVVYQYGEHKLVLRLSAIFAGSSILNMLNLLKDNRNVRKPCWRIGTYREVVKIIQGW
jgi:hypothetical protein